MWYQALCVLLLVCAVSAKVGEDSMEDADCENAEYCKEMEEDKDQEENEEAAEPKMTCMMKKTLYSKCESDHECMSEKCIMMQPGLELIAPTLGDSGQCVSCKTDNDCGNNEFCEHPVVNAECMKSGALIEAMKNRVKKMKDEMEDDDDDEDDEEKYKGGKGGYMSKRPGGQGYGPGRGMMADGQGMQNGQGGQNEALTMLQRVVQMLEEMQQGTNKQQTTNSQRFPFRSTRRKRGLSPYAINAPTMQCKPLKPINAACQRMDECQSRTCSIDLMCV